MSASGESDAPFGPNTMRYADALDGANRRHFLAWVGSKPRQIREAIERVPPCTRIDSPDGLPSVWVIGYREVLGAEIADILVSSTDIRVDYEGAVATQHAVSIESVSVRRAT